MVSNVGSDGNLTLVRWPYHIKFAELRSLQAVICAAAFEHTLTCSSCPLLASLQRDDHAPRLAIELSSAS
jgi:hypothetical protein